MSLAVFVAIESASPTARVDCSTAPLLPLRKTADGIAQDGTAILSIDVGRWISMDG